ncbi:MAG: P1 family peptidase [Vicinamibacteria bacterium]
MFGTSRPAPGRRSSRVVAIVGSATLAASAVLGQPRARDLGVPFGGAPGRWNAITDVPGVEVGHVTLIEGEGALQVGNGPVRTGVTVILPRGESKDPVFAGWFTLNGNGEMTGTTWVEESGFLEGPIAITNTHSVGVVRDAIISWQAEREFLFQPWSLPVVAETYDGFLNDINGFHVRKEHVTEALQTAESGAVEEGAVGGGTGMICYGFKGGIGTASRVLEGGHTVAALVQANFGGRPELTIAGVPVGMELKDVPSPRDEDQALGSIIIVVATDAPLLPHQLKRLARRASLGIARTGAISGNGSGDIFIAFSTGNPGAASAESASAVTLLPNDKLNPIFRATVESVEEAIVNALVAGKTMTGVDGHRVEGLPHRELRRILQKYNRLAN